METPLRRYPKRLKAGSPVAVPQPPAVHTDTNRRKVACLVPSPQPPAVQSEGDDVCSLPSSDMCERNDERTDSLAAGCLAHELPPSSSSLNVPASSLADLFSVYSYLRCFSRLLFLSPFTMEKFVSALCADRGDGLLDSVHLSLLEAVKRHFRSSESAVSCFGDLNWDLLDVVTWPVYLVSFLRTQGYSKVRKHSLVKAGLGRGEYQRRVSVKEKLAILSFLCDHALQSEDSRTEVTVRLMYALQTIAEPTLQILGEGDPDWRPQEARAENKAQEAPLLRKASDRLLKSAEKGEWSKEMQRAATALGGDGNSNDCMLCGMDGVLLCCDACPAAYHSRCVGITKSKLSAGDWFCPECRLISTGTPYSKRLHGAQLLGIDPQGRYFLVTCDYLLVSEVVDNEATYRYYGATELPVVLKYLQACGYAYKDLQHAIRQQWDLESISPSESSSPEGPFGSQETPPSSPRRASIARQSSRKKKMQNQMDIDMPGQEDCTKQEGKGKSLKVQIGEPFRGPYVNMYAHGYAVAAAADTLATWQGGGDPAWVPGTRARGTSANEQVRAFTQALPSFTWPSNRKRFGEKCGWCGLCSSNSRGCLLVQTDAQVSRSVDDLKPLKLSKGPRHLGTVATYVLHIEQTLHALLVGWPWESSFQRQRWRTRLEESPSVRSIRRSLLQLEAALRPIAVSTDWVKHADIAPVLQPTTCLKRKAVPWETPNKVPPGRQIGIQWRRGGRVARLLCDWEALPRQNLRQAARQGGQKPLFGLLSNDSTAVPQRTKQCAWRARVQTASSVAQIGLQVRNFDMQIKWKELLADPGESKRPYIYSKSTEAGITKYLVAMTDEEIEAEKQNKDTQSIVGLPISSEGLRQVWKVEQQLPLCQLKWYEEKFFKEKVQKVNQVSKSKGGNKKVFKEKVQKANQGKKSKGGNKGGTKQKGRGFLKRRSLNVIVDKLLDAIKVEEKKLEGKKLRAGKSPTKRTPELKKPLGRPPRPRCQRCQVICEKACLSTVEGMLLCGQCLQLRHGKRLRKPSAKFLEMLSNEEADNDETDPPKVGNGEIPGKDEAPSLKLEWNGTSLRKSDRKSKRMNLNISAFAWHGPYLGLANGSGVIENGRKRARLESARLP